MNKIFNLEYILRFVGGPQRYFWNNGWWLLHQAIRSNQEEDGMAACLLHCSGILFRPGIYDVGMCDWRRGWSDRAI